MFESRRDQAWGLRQLFKRRHLRLLPVMVDVGDLQHCAFVANLAAALTRIGRQTVLLDGERALIAPALGLKARYDLLHALTGETSLQDVTMRAAEGFWVVPAARALGRLSREGGAVESLLTGFGQLSEPIDTVLLCAGATTLAPLIAHQGKETALICGTGPQEVAAAYARMKTLRTDFGFTEFRAIYHRASSPADAAACHERLASAAERFLGAQVRFGGAVEQEGALQLAERTRSTVFAVAAGSQAARSFERIAVRSLDWPVPVFGGSEPILH